MLRVFLFIALCFVGCISASVVSIRNGAGESLTVMTWNILAPIWVNRTQLKQSGVDLNLLNDDVRLKLVIDEIKNIKPDILNLQEVQENTFRTIKTALAGTYQASAFSPHKLGYWSVFLMPGTKYVKNGVATFYNKRKFTLMKKVMFPTSSDGNMALATVLKLRPALFKFVKQVNCRSPVLVINCHLEVGATPAASTLRVKQGSAVMKKAAQLAKRYAVNKPLLFIVGDLNTMNPYPGFTNFKTNGYSDAVEVRGGNASYTVYFTAPVPAPVIGLVSAVTLDHIFFKSSKKPANRVKVLYASSPSIKSKEMDKATYFARVKDLVINQMDNKGICSSEDAVNYLLKSKTFSTLFKLKNEKSTTDNNANRVLRLGSDHLPVLADFEI